MTRTIPVYWVGQVQVLQVITAAVCTLCSPFGFETVSANNTVEAHFDAL
ncbi:MULTISPECIES: hypothetical protein [unclassified Cryobacterium]|nr:MULTISPECIES: hypothetical protein [unclassified Cryobacterium]